MAQWMLYTKRADFTKLGEKYNISPVTARIMTNRDVQEEEFRDYINCQLSGLNSPWLMKDMDIATDIITEKISGGKKIRIIGDYDIDGICSTWILVRGIEGAGGIVDMDIPDRVRDGYGINISIIDRAIKDGIDTIITCDNGIAAIDQVKYAREKGITVIVTDHHEPPLGVDGKQIKVNGNGIIDPKQTKCKYPYKDLCGGGVAYKLIEALYEKLRLPLEREGYMEMAAVATIGDVVDLKGENRIIAKNGLESLRSTKNVGLRALMEECSVDMEQLSSYHIGFVIGPCLNAGGRLETAKMSYELLRAKNIEDARTMANELKSLNDKRKDMTDRGVEAGILKAENKIREGKKVLVLYLENLHESIAGIVAGRIKELYYKPVIVLTGSDQEGIAKGSGRSVEDYNMYEELSRVSPLFQRFGGHRMAAGLSIKSENINILEEKLNNTEWIGQDGRLWIDVLLPFTYVTRDLINELSMLEPFGKGNEKPLFAERQVELLEYRVMGKNRNALRLTVRNNEKYPMAALYFGDIEKLEREIIEKYGQEAMGNAKMGIDNSIRMSIAYYPQINNYGGKSTIQIVIKDISM